MCPDAAAPPCVGDGGDHGLLSADPAVNPDWADATAVFVAYCDGGSFAGALDAPLVVEGVPVFLRGSAVLTALFADILETMRAGGGASEVLLKGASAGGQALLIHANALAATLRRAAGAPRVSLLIDAGLFLDTPSMDGPNTIRPFTEAWVALHNATGSLPPACTSPRPPAAAPAAPAPAAGGLSPQLCALSQTLLAAVDPSLPLFIAQFAADSAQLSWVMGLRCKHGLPMSLPPAAPPPAGSTLNACNARKVAYLNAFRARMLDALAPVLRSGSPLHGAWVAECGLHIVGNSDGGWTALRVQNQTQRETVRAWYARAAAAAAGAAGRGSGVSGGVPVARSGGSSLSGAPLLLPRVVDGEWGTNPTCTLYAPPAVPTVPSP